MTSQAYWIRTYLHGDVVTQESGYSDILDDDPAFENGVVQVFADITYQTFQGFGGAFTEAAGSVLEQLPQKVAETIVADYFGPQGLGYVWGRIPVDSCDFALGTYSALIVDKGEPLIDERVLREHDRRYILPYVQQAQALLADQGKGPIQLCMVPWSPPAWMKSNSSRFGGGSLLPGFHALWADYLCQYARVYQELGFEVRLLGVQNEPNASQTWDSCLYSPQEEQAFIRDHLYPCLLGHGQGTVRISIWDHNRDRMVDRTRAVCSGPVRPMVGAVAFHWYSGDHFESVGLVHDLFPELLLIFTEGCVEYKHFSQSAQIEHGLRYAHQIMGDLNHGAHAWLDWNLVLDSNGGPNHVGNNCDAPILASIPSGTYEKRASFYFIGHFSRYIRPGAIRLAHSRFTADLGITAWRNMDGELVAVVLNETGHTIVFSLRYQGICIPCIAKEKSILTLLVPGTNLRP
jgi:glucosylceramidase